MSEVDRFCKIIIDLNCFERVWTKLDDVYRI